MKHTVSPLILGLMMLGLCAAPVYAATGTASLQSQINSLKSEVNKLKNQQSSNSSNTAKTKSSRANNPAKLSTTDTSIAAGNSQIEGPTDLPTQGPLYLPVDFDVPGQSFVSSGPYIGIPLEFTGGHLIVNSPSINEDVVLLQVNKNINQRLAALGRPKESVGSHVLLSGLVEGQALYRWGGGASSVSDIDLTTANFDAFIMGPSTWTSAFMELAYDNNIGTQTGSFSSNNRMLNSRVFINKAFVILGDFQKSPFYASFGQMYVPFGTYSTTMVSAPLTRILARTQARALVVGYKQQTTNSLLATAYIFNGPSHASATTHVNNGGINISYNFKEGNYIATVGGGVIGNMADSLGMQFTGNNNNTPPLFGGFGGPTETYTIPGTTTVIQQNTGSEQLVHRVPAYDINLKIGIGDNIQLIGEYITASTHFSSTDLTFDGHDAKPSAFNIEGVYNMPWFVNPTSISVSYQKSKDALAIGLPSSRYSIAVNRSFWKNTLQTLEFRRDYDYGKTDTSTGSEIAGPSGSGKAMNMVTLQFDYYF